MLGYEANYAGTSFATLDKRRDKFRYGSDRVTIVADRIQPRSLGAVGYDELERLTYDLPEAMEYRRGKSKPAPSTMLMAILSGFERRGRWYVPGRMTTFTLFGGGVVDLRYADFTSSDVEIHAYSILGGQTILLPPEVNVEVHGVGVMGGFDQKVEGSGTPGAPKITIRGFSLWGGVGIKRRKRNSSETR